MFVLAFSLLSVLKRSVEYVHREDTPELDVSTYHLALQLKSGYEGVLIALPAASWAQWLGGPEAIIQRLLQLARRLKPKQVATARIGPKLDKPKGHLDVRIASSHVSTARVLKQARA